MPRLINPASAFTASLRAAQKSESQGRTTITKGEAEKALKNLDGAPVAERAAIVQGFLDGKSADALSSKARQVLVDFVNNTGGAGGGDSALHVKTAARDEAAQAERNVQKAQGRLEQLIKSGAPGEIKGGLQQVRAWLDAAEADVLQAKGQLKKLADSAAKAATHELDGAQKDLAKAAEDIQQIIEHAKAGNVKKADLAEVRAWLAEPLPELQHAVGALMVGQAGGGGPVRHTLKYPSDNEDHGVGTGNNGTATTMRYPSDNEDSGFPVGGLKERKVSAQHVTAMRKAVDKAGALQWHKGSVIESHLGERFARADLAKGLTAFIPLGALTPTATAADPNKVREFYLERTHGKRTESAGPIKLP